MEYSKLIAIMLFGVTLALIYQAYVALHWLDIAAIPACGFTAFYIWHKNKPNDWKRPERKKK